MSADVHGLAGAYALHALTEEDERLFLRHLAACATCQAEVADYERTAALLGAAAEEAPPSGMRAALLERVDATPQVRDGVVPITLRRRLTPVLMPVAAGLVLVLLGLGGVTLRQRQELGELRAAQAAQSEALLSVLAAEDLQRLAMRGDGSATVLWSPARRTAVLVASGLADLPEDRAYQLWLMADGVPIPSRVFRPGRDGAMVALLSSTPERFQAVAVTVESLRGATSPTGPMVLAPA